MTTETPELEDKMKQSNLRTSLAFLRTIDAEKRTHLAELRTGFGILTIPMSLLTILIATSNYYAVEHVFGFIVVLSVGIILLTLVGGYFVVDALRKIRADDHLKGKCDDIACLVSDFNGFNHDHD